MFGAAFAGPRGLRTMAECQTYGSLSATLGQQNQTITRLGACVETDVEVDAQRDEAPPGLDRRRVARTLGLVLLASITLVQVTRIAAADFRDGPAIGDQASYLMQALSISADADLSYDADDILRWEELGWSSAPRGLFYQTYDHGFAFAKPYGYSMYAAGFVKIFGAIRGIAIANAALVLGLWLTLAAILRHRFGDLTSIFGATVFTFTTAAYIYGYVIHPDLFLAVLAALITLLAVRCHVTSRVGYIYLAAAILGFAVAEKPQFLGVFAALLAVLIWQHQRTAKAVMLTGAAFAGSFIVSVIPYLFYSDYESWNPYSGERYQSPGGDLPFNSTLSTDSFRAASDQFFSFSYWVEILGDDTPEILGSIGYYIVGRHTGAIAFYPIAVLLVVATVLNRRWNGPSVAVLFGVAAYAAFYVVFFPFNYYGGGQTFGNRYFLQVVPILIALPVFARFSMKLTVKLAALGAVAGLMFLGPSHRSPSDAFTLLSRTSVMQQLLPFEYDRAGEVIFACGTFEREVIVTRGSDLCHEVSGISVVRVER